MIVYTLKSSSKGSVLGEGGLCKLARFRLYACCGSDNANLACLELFLRFNLLGKVPGSIHINNMDGKFMAVNFEVSFIKTSNVNLRQWSCSRRPERFALKVISPSSKPSVGASTTKVQATQI